ncbi:hypothetical protein GCM10009677_59600 [Sphaerisporangium rubeum]|uniref:Uncharacterized protein n=1 Tax=Sphaerisporangium rubeum TaxID=321317 RepID=A0A7X0IJZ6_9ACTN|nr:hypothetical protein [Sphaerisporangium rubeum]MBB6476124.1 hypothetical protein [Sphaerisporangium rubeum]
MTAARTLTGFALVAGILALTPLAANADTAAAPSTTVSAQSAATSEWGTYYAPGRKAKAYGTLWAAPKDDPSRPTSLVKVKGKVFDKTRTGSACGWAVFRISYGDSSGNVPHKFRTFTTCKYNKAKKFSFDFKNVYQVELKVCSEPKAAKPSLNCLYAGTWKNLYTYFEQN